MSTVSTEKRMEKIKLEEIMYTQKKVEHCIRQWAMERAAKTLVGRAGKASSRKMQKGTVCADPSAPIQLYSSIINAYIVTFVNGGVSKGRTDG